MNWQYSDFEHQFKDPPGGDLLDIRIPGIDRDSWRTLLRLIDSDYPYQFGVIDAETTGDGERRLPEDPMTLITFADGANPWLHFNFGGVKATVHFFGPDWVEICIYRYKINAETFPRLLDLLERIGAALDQDVLLMEESSDAWCLMLYDREKRLIRRPCYGRGIDPASRQRMLASIDRILEPFWHDPVLLDIECSGTDEYFAKCRTAYTALVALFPHLLSAAQLDTLTVDECMVIDSLRSELFNMEHAEADIRRHCRRRLRSELQSYLEVLSEGVGPFDLGRWHPLAQ